MDSAEARDNMVLRLKKIEGQVKGIQRMLDDGRACQDILTQLIAIRSGIEQVGLMMLDTQIERCMGEAAQGDKEKVKSLQQTLKMWTRFS